MLSDLFRNYAKLSTFSGSIFSLSLFPLPNETLPFKDDFFYFQKFLVLTSFEISIYFEVVLLHMKIAQNPYLN